MRPITAAFLSLTLVLLVTAGCVKQYSPPNDSQDVTGGPTDVPTVVVAHTIEFRAVGLLASDAVIAYGSAQDGTTTITTAIPWSASFKTTRKTLFVYVTGTAQSEGSLSVSIYVDGELFREADKDVVFAGDQVQASGTAQFNATALGLLHK